MKRPYIFLKLCGILLLLNLAAEARPPNLLIIMADDLGYGDLGCYGATEIKTPHMDRLAKAGQVFTAAYAPSSTCTPSRYSLLTGDYPWRQTARTNSILAGDAPLAFVPGQFTLARQLKVAGFRTGIVGKWHLGLGDGTTPLDFNGEIKPGPLEMGFDYCHIIPATVDRVPSVWIENHRVVNLDPADPLKVSYEENFADEPTGLEQPDLLRYGADKQHSGSIHNGISRIGYQSGGKAARFIDEELPDTVVAKAAAFIVENKERPFYLNVGLFEPHVPRTVKPEFEGASGSGLRGDTIQQADWQIGQILKVLDEQGLTGETIVILTSDNGPVLYDGYQDRAIEELNGHRPAGPWSGWKYLVKEGGCRVPFVLRWPGNAKPGTRTEMICLTDIVATMAALTGSGLPPGVAVDSMNQLPVILGTTQNPVRTSVVLQGVSGAMAFRDRDWKLILRNGKKATAGIGAGADSEDNRFATGNNPGDQLYNLAEDPGENRDRALEFPQRVAEMRASLAKIQALK
jgi:arylsulfatase A-like enzyme